MKNILIITYNYPPSNTPGVFRILGFVNYLNDCGYNPIVLTVSNPTDVDYDEELKSFIRTNVLVYRAVGLDIGKYMVFFLKKAKLILNSIRRVPASVAANQSDDAELRRERKRIRTFVRLLLNFPDSRIGWVPFGLLKGYRLIRKHKIDYVLTSSPPHSSQLIGALLKLLSPKLIWVADYRDPWRDAILLKPKLPKWLDRIERQLEKASMESADLIIANTAKNRSNLLFRYPWLDESKVCVITNGFDREDFGNLSPLRASELEGVISCVHVGSLYPGMIENLLKALSALVKDDPQCYQKIQFYFIGYSNVEDRDRVAQKNLSHLISFRSVVSYKESLKYMMGADLLLCLLPSNSEIGHCIPGKLYNYMAVGQPILAVIPEGDAAQLICEQKKGVVIHPSETSAIKDYLKEVIEAGRPLNVPKEKIPSIRAYERRFLVRELSKRLDTVSQK